MDKSDTNSNLQRIKKAASKTFSTLQAAGDVKGTLFAPPGAQTHCVRPHLHRLQRCMQHAHQDGGGAVGNDGVHPGCQARSGVHDATSGSIMCRTMPAPARFVCFAACNIFASMAAARRTGH